MVADVSYHGSRPEAQGWLAFPSPGYPRDPSGIILPVDHPPSGDIGIPAQIGLRDQPLEH